MTFEVVITKRAERQLHDATAWYAKQAPHIVDAWFDGFVNAIVSLGTHPKQQELARENEALPFELRQLLYGFGKRKTHRALFVVRPIVSQQPEVSCGFKRTRACRT